MKKIFTLLFLSLFLFEGKINNSVANENNVEFSNDDKGLSFVGSFNKPAFLDPGFNPGTMERCPYCYQTYLDPANGPELLVCPNCGRRFNEKEWTIMIYMSGCDLESRVLRCQPARASADITEMLNVPNQPDDVNVIIQTGGAEAWSPAHGISSDKIQRWHIKDGQLVKDADLSQNSMGDKTVFRSFIDWGLRKYPAKKTGVIMWGHGQGMKGVCFDENFENSTGALDSLLNTECDYGFNLGFSDAQQSSKLEFIGYDACLMQVQDVADMNSKYFKYMLASENNVINEGLNYNSLLSAVYSKQSTLNILQSTVDGYILSNVRDGYFTDRTMSVLDLSKMQSYKTAWENMSIQLLNKLNTMNKAIFKASLKSVLRTVQHFGREDYLNYCVFDAKDFVNKINYETTLNVGYSYINPVINALNNMVLYSAKGSGAGNSNGLSMYFDCSPNCYYENAQTRFTTWRDFNIATNINL